MPFFVFTFFFPPTSCSPAAHPDPALASSVQDIRSLIKTMVIVLSLIYFFSVDPDEVSEQIDAMERAAAQAELEAEAAA